MATRNIRWLSFFNIAFARHADSRCGTARLATWSPLWIAAGINVLNLPLLYAFIFGRWGMPEMGVAGAAVAAGIAFSFGTLVLMTLWVRQKFRVRHVPAVGGVEPDCDNW